MSSAAEDSRDHAVPVTQQTEDEPVHEVWTEHEAKPRRKWHRETFACAFSGHVVPASTVARLRPEDAGLGVDLPDGRRFARCVRCDAWVQTTPPTHPARETLPSLDQLEVPKRGKGLRDQLVLRLIAIDRAIHSILFALIAVAVFLVEFHFVGLRREAQSLLNSLDAALGQTGQGASHSILSTEL